MPKETIKDGTIRVIEAAGSEPIRTLDGKPMGMSAHRTHEYVVGEELKPGDVLEQEPTFSVNWTKMGPDVHGYAQLSVSIPEDRLKEMLDASPAGEPLVVFSDFLSRAELNRAITLLRHVRDSAHGVDA